MNAHPRTFEDALLARLTEHVEAPAARFVRRPVLVAAAVVALALGLVVVGPGLGSDPAYSVQEGNAGTVTVRVDRLEDAGGLEDALAEAGIAADVLYLPDGRQCAPGRYEPVDRPLSGMTVSLGADRLEVTLPPGTVRDGEVFVMAVSGASDGSAFTGWTDFDVTAGPVADCVPRAG